MARPTFPPNSTMAADKHSVSSANEDFAEHLQHVSQRLKGYHILTLEGKLDRAHRLRDSYQRHYEAVHMGMQQMVCVCGCQGSGCSWL